FIYTVSLSLVTNRLGKRIRVQNRELEHRNRTDPAVQMPNRPYFESVAASELSHYHQTQRPAALVLLDVDNFKSINDRYGHVTGDAVLKRIATLLRESVRDTDLPARRGGDEFALLAADTPLSRGQPTWPSASVAMRRRSGSKPSPASPAPSALAWLRPRPKSRRSMPGSAPPMPPSTGPRPPAATGWYRRRRAQKEQNRGQS